MKDLSANDEEVFRYLAWNQGADGLRQHYQIAAGTKKNYDYNVPAKNIFKNWPSEIIKINGKNQTRKRIAPNGAGRGFSRKGIEELRISNPQKLAEGFIDVWRVHYDYLLGLQGSKSVGVNRTGLSYDVIKDAFRKAATKDISAEALINFGIIENGLNTDSPRSANYQGMFQMDSSSGSTFIPFLTRHRLTPFIRNGAVWNDYGRNNILEFAKDAVILIVNNFNNFKKATGFSKSNPLVLATPKDLPGQTDGFAPPPVFGADSGTTTPTTATTAATQEPIAQDKKTNDTPPDTPKQPTGPITQIKRLFKPTIRPIDIELDVEAESLQNKRIIAATLGYTPVIFYNGVDIKATDISSFKLYHEGMLPKIECVIQDTYGIFKRTGMPGDDTKISLFMNSKSRILASIRLDFKVLEFKEISPSKYRVSAVVDIPRIYLKKYTSFSDKTSLEALQELAKDLGLGFCTNITSTNDKQNWINTSNSQRHFMSDIVEHSYVSDTSFQVCYVDYYYNLCFVDISREYERDVNEDVGVSCVGFDTVTGTDKKADDKIESLVLTNERNLSQSSGYIDKYKVTNNSTTLSLKNSYRTDVKYLDIQKKEILYFTVEAQTGDPSKTQVLKATSGDEQFYKENTKSSYGGKLDANEDGSGNLHANSAYTIVNNRRNLKDFAKISSLMYLPNCNLNLYPYRKVKVIIMHPKETTDEDLISVRLTGDWLISSIEFILTQGKFMQVLTCLKRELSLTKAEQDANPVAKNLDQNNFKTAQNPDPSVLPNSVYKVGEIYTVKDVQGLEYKMTVQEVSIDGKEITASVDTRKIK